MTIRRVGPAAASHGATCTYEPLGSGTACASTAAVHVMVEDVRYGRCGLVACDEHADLARADGAVQEHPHEPVCGQPDALWDPRANRCVMTGTGYPKTSSAALVVRELARRDETRTDAELAGCTCRHSVEAHLHRTGRCGGKDSYDLPCACPSFEIDKEALQLFRPDDD